MPTPAALAVRDRLLQARAHATPLVPSDADRAAVPDDATGFALQHAQGVALGAWGPGEVPRHWKSGGPRRGARLVHAPQIGRAHV